jgi:hypothetical protein
MKSPSKMYADEWKKQWKKKVLDEYSGGSFMGVSVDDEQDVEENIYMILNAAIEQAKIIQKQNKEIYGLEMQSLDKQKSRSFLDFLFK